MIEDDSSSVVHVIKVFINGDLSSTSSSVFASSFSLLVDCEQLHILPFSVLANVVDGAILIATSRPSQ